MQTGREQSRPRRPESGMTLLETMIALAMLFVVATGLTMMATYATVTTENQGHLVTRTAEYAQDKMEQLMSLRFDDTFTDTINEDCVDYLEGYDCSDPDIGEVGLSPGGSLNHSAPADHYVDYLDASGNPMGGGVTAPDGWFYMRVWLIEDTGLDATLPANVKRITVSVTTRTTVEMESGNQLQSVLSTLKTSPF